jgi:hypothetical protein
MLLEYGENMSFCADRKHEKAKQTVRDLAHAIVEIRPFL